MKESVINTPMSTPMPSWRIYVSEDSSILTSTLVIAGTPADVQRLFGDSRPDFLSHIFDDRRETNPVKTAPALISL